MDARVDGEKVFFSLQFYCDHPRSQSLLIEQIFGNGNYFWARVSLS